MIEAFFKSFSHYKSMDAVDPRGVASFDTSRLIGRIYIGDHKTLLNTYNLSEDFFKVFPIISLWELYVATTTRVLIQSVQKPYAAFT